MSDSKKIGLVGAGRMGANIARRLKDVGYEIAAIYDVRHETARELAGELGGEATESLPRVTQLSDVVLTVVTDDAAMYEIFSREGPSLLAGAGGRTFVNCATVTPKVHIDIQTRA